MRLSNTLCLLLLAAAPLGACAKSSTTPEPENAYSAQPPVVEPPVEPEVGMKNTVSDPEGPGEKPPSTQEMPSTAKMVALTDGQIVKVTSSVNQGEIAQAKAVQSKSKNAAVKKFAAHMIAEHTKADKQGAAWAKKSNVTPEDSDVDSDLKSDAEKNLGKISGAEATDLDKTYVDAQVEQHEAVLELLDKRIIPSAASPELKASLENTRIMVDKHATEAKQLQEKLAAK